MPKLWVKNSGTWKQVLRLWVHQNGSWQDVIAGLINQNDVGTQFYPDTVVTTTYSTAGTYSYTVPAGITSIIATVVGAGGGGGSSVFAGDGHGAANGGSGGYYQNQTISVTPGETLTITIGAGGAGGTSGGDGGTGGTTSIYRGASSLYIATGGSGGDGVVGDNNPTMKGYGGSPSGVNGSYTASWMVNRNTPGQGYDGQGQNPTGYGSGGLGGNSVGGAAQGGTGLVGGTGFVQIRSLITVVYGDPTVNTTTGTRSGASYSFTVPLGVYSVTVNGAGGGGGAYAFHDGGYCQHAWAGGPGGGVSNLIIPVSPGDVISGVYGNGGGAGYYNGGQGGPGSATTIYKNGSLVATCGAGGQNSGGTPSAGTTTITGGYSGTATTGTVQSTWLDGCDGGYPSGTHYDPWSWVLGGSPSYPQSVLGTVAKQAPAALGSNYQRAGMPQVCGWVSITY